MEGKGSCLGRPEQGAEGSHRGLAALGHQPWGWEPGASQPGAVAHPGASPSHLCTFLGRGMARPGWGAATGTARRSRGTVSTPPKTALSADVLGAGSVPAARGAAGLGRVAGRALSILQCRWEQPRASSAPRQRPAHGPGQGGFTWVPLSPGWSQNHRMVWEAPSGAALRYLGHPRVLCGVMVQPSSPIALAESGALPFTHRCCSTEPGAERPCSLLAAKIWQQLRPFGRH